jgi:hypothetical protein
MCAASGHAGAECDLLADQIEHLAAPLEERSRKALLR